jgi:hypothetical protein
MPKITETPETLRPYRFHGVDIDYTDGEEAVGTCPFCGRDGKFSVNIKDGVWKCWVCQSGSAKGGGNVYTFLRLLWELCDKQPFDTTDLVKSRTLLFPETLMYWGVTRSVLTGDVLVPGYGVDGKLNQLYSYRENYQTKKMTMYPTPTVGHQFHRVTRDLWDAKKPEVHVLEGPWDGMAWYEALRVTKKVDKNLALTGNPVASLLADINVLAIPGCGSVGEPFKKLLPLLTGKTVTFFFDNDHAKEHHNQVVDGAGYAALKRAVAICAAAEQPPLEIRYLHWGENGYDKALKHQFDVRDWLSSSGEAVGRVKLVESLMTRVKPIPPEWVPGRARTAAPGGVKTELLPCSSWRELSTAWKKALKWTPGLDRTLSVMLASILSTKAIGDQLWLRVIGPPSCGKSVLCEALSTNREYIFANSTMTGIHSGWKTDRAGEEDHSMIPKIDGKTLIIKDGDTLLQAVNKDKILSELRDLYDRTSRVHYGHGVRRVYEGINTTVILCGTESLRMLDTSELGERFLSVRVLDTIDEDLEDEVALRVAYRMDREMEIEASTTSQTQDGPDMVLAKQLTGGYVTYLRENARNLYRDTKLPEESVIACTRLGKFVAYMRARPSKNQEETAGREMSFRLVSQHVRLAKSLAVVLNKPGNDPDVLDRVRQVALDTCRGRTLDICHALAKSGQAGLAVGSLLMQVHETEVKLRDYLRFLIRINVVKSFKRQARPGIISNQTFYGLTDTVLNLYRDVTGVKDA